MPTSVKYPDLRLNLKDAAWCLSELHYQRTVWGTRSSPPTGSVDFGDAIEWVLGDTEPDNPAGLVGEVLCDQDELTRFLKLVEHLSATIDRIGPLGTYDEVKDLPEWARSRAAAAALYQAMVASDGSASE